MGSSEGLSVEVVEVGPRDGFQGISPLIPTADKFAFVERAVASGINRIEIGSFVSARALPQLADTPEVLAFCAGLPALKPQVLVPSERRGLDALAAGAKAIAFVLSVSEAHNRNNVRLHPNESVESYKRLLEATPSDLFVRLNIATAFDCPFAGRVSIDNTIALLDKLAELRPGVEICLCDTTGKADPDHVEDLFDACIARYGSAPVWAYHAHDTYGLGLLGVHSAFRKGVRIFDSSFGGIGGCPFAPGATGNIATEDLVWMFERMGVDTGIDLGALLPVSRDAAALPGAVSGGRVREAMQRSACA